MSYSVSNNFANMVESNNNSNNLVYVLIRGGDYRKENTYSMIGVFKSKESAINKMMKHAEQYLKSEPNLTLRTLNNHSFENIVFKDHDPSFWSEGHYTKPEHIYRFMKKESVNDAKKENEDDDEEEEEEKEYSQYPAFYVIIPTQIQE